MLHESPAICSRAQFVAPRLKPLHRLETGYESSSRDIRKVALWVGHSDIRTTEIYLRVHSSGTLEGWMRSKRRATGIASRALQSAGRSDRLAIRRAPHNQRFPLNGKRQNSNGKYCANEAGYQQI